MNQPPPPGNYPPPGNQGPQGWQPPPGNYPPPPQGNYPPPGNYPPGNYPPPPAGNYPPPPPGNYPPPPPGYYPPPPGYGPAGGSGLSIGDGFSWAFKQFGKNAVPLLVSTLLFALIFGVLSSVLSAIMGAVSPESVSGYSESGDSGFSAGFSFYPQSPYLMVLFSFIMSIIIAMIACAYYTGLLAIADGQKVGIGSFFKLRNPVAVLVALIIVSVVESIVQFLFIAVRLQFLSVIPVLIIEIFAIFVVVAIVDRGLSAIDGIKASFNIAKADFGKVLLVWLVVIAIIVVGVVACLVGSLVAVPVALLFKVYAYRRLTGGQVAPAL